jgi:hypothetical protein
MSSCLLLFECSCCSMVLLRALQTAAVQATAYLSDIVQCADVGMQQLQGRQLGQASRPPGLVAPGPGVIDQLGQVSVAATVKAPNTAAVQRAPQQTMIVGRTTCCRSASESLEVLPFALNLCGTSPSLPGECPVNVCTAAAVSCGGRQQKCCCGEPKTEVCLGSAVHLTGCRVAATAAA